MGLLQPQAGAVVFGAPTRADLDGQAGRHESPVEAPAGCVDRCGILQWAASLRLDGGVAEFLSRLRAFAGVARFAGQSEVDPPVTTATGTRNDRFHVERRGFCPAVRATAFPRVHEILPYLVACQRALLIGYTSQFRVLWHLRVEAHQFHTECRDRTQPTQPVDPGEGRLDPMGKAGSQPPLGPAPVEEAGQAVARFALPPASANGTPEVVKPLAGD